MIIIWTNLIVGCVFECDLYWSGEVGCGTSITLETGRDDWRGQMKHKLVVGIATFEGACIDKVLNESTCPNQEYN